MQVTSHACTAQGEDGDDAADEKGADAWARRGDEGATAAKPVGQVGVQEA